LAFGAAKQDAAGILLRIENAAFVMLEKWKTSLKYLKGKQLCQYGTDALGGMAPISWILFAHSCTVAGSCDKMRRHSLCVPLLHARSNKRLLLLPAIIMMW